MSDDNYSFNELLFTKKLLDSKMKDDRPDGFVVTQFYDMKTMKLQMLSLAISTEKGERITFLGEMYDSSDFPVDINPSTLKSTFPNSFKYETKVARNGSTRSRFPYELLQNF